MLSRKNGGSFYRGQAIVLVQHTDKFHSEIIIIIIFNFYPSLLKLPEEKWKNCNNSARNIYLKN